MGKDTLLQDEKNTSGNIVFIEFYNKKNFPPGIWMSEPDFCKWKSYGFTCLAIRDMSLGMWRGFVGITNKHPFFNKKFEDLLHQDWIDTLNIHGGLAAIGKLPIHYNEYNNDNWWFSFECTQGEDFIPLLNNDEGPSNFLSYKNLHFVRRETNYLAQQLAEAQNANK
jgi:hypothetical protein